MKLFSKTLFFVGAIAVCLQAVEAKQDGYSYNQLTKKISNHEDPLAALQQLMNCKTSIESVESTSSLSPLDLINCGGKCTKEEYVSKFIELCEKVGIQSRHASVKGKNVFDFCVNGEWTCFDLDEGTRFLGLDNNTFVSSDDMMDDPFIILRSEYSLKSGVEKLSSFQIVSSHSGKGFVSPSIKPEYISPVATKEKCTLTIVNSEQVFNYTTPQFELSCTEAQPAKEVWWQISNDREFKFVPHALSHVTTSASVITLDPILETFFNPNETYYLRVKGSKNEQWSKTCEFRVNKPEGITDVEFERLEDNVYEINWERYADEKSSSIEYLVFGSNSLDFIPSVYNDVQINAIVNGKITDQERNDNLVAVTHDAKILVPGNLAYYRIIVRENGQLSVPSRLVHVYDHNLIQPRNVMQLSSESDEELVIKRVLIPSTYPWTEISLPLITAMKTHENSLFAIEKNFRRAKAEPGNYPYNTYVPKEIWEKVRMYFMPENHPAKPKLDRMFSALRIIQSPEIFMQAGFKRFRPGKMSHIMASSHADLKEYFIKAFSDEEVRIIADWMKLTHRIKGALTVRDCIKKHGYEKYLKVPRKWIYPLPMNPSPPKSDRYLRKNFILVAENMITVDSNSNKKMYQSNMSKPMMEALFTVFHECGLWDSVFAFNVPFCKDGKLAFIDTEYHHKWPVPYQKMLRYFSKEMGSYWEQLAKKAPPPPSKK